MQHVIYQNTIKHTHTNPPSFTGAEMPLSLERWRSSHQHHKHSSAKTEIFPPLLGRFLCVGQVPRSLLLLLVNKSPFLRGRISLTLCCYPGFSFLIIFSVVVFCLCYYCCCYYLFIIDDNENLYQCYDYGSCY